MGTDWPMPADLSALDPVCLNKSREVKWGKFGEGMMGPCRVCVQCLVCVCMRQSERERRERESKRDGGTEDDKGGRQNRMVLLMEMGCDSSPWDCVINWDQVTSSMSGQ